MSKVPMPDLSDESSFYGLYSPPCKRTPAPANKPHRFRRGDGTSGGGGSQLRHRALLEHPREIVPSASSPAPELEASDVVQPMDISTPELSSVPPSTPIPTHDFDVPISSTDTTPVRPNRPSPNEPISSFLARLRPSSTLSTSPTGSWIYTTSYSYEQPRADLKKLVADGTKALKAHEEAIAQVRAEHAKKPKKKQTPAALTRELTQHRKDLENTLFNLARQTNVVSGKWLLFVLPEKVDEVWGIVAEATAKGELGFGAKVATAAVAADDDNAKKARLIAIYTKDYEDRADVERVLRKMAALKLVDLDGRPVYYKCDAYTHLDIRGGNEWGLRGSMYSSRDFGKK
ncbi:hypothetical protein AnigIFM60653_011974 [Aspergillus niger]|nr:hypothetical protein AnigIFM50267_009781 [Aspergillus niger]GLA09643.1 hypothetical protein AnigIFM60653_011974 [Aspergillus niger]